jgi:hypothetical protein
MSQSPSARRWTKDQKGVTPAAWIALAGAED